MLSTKQYIKVNVNENVLSQTKKSSCPEVDKYIHFLPQKKLLLLFHKYFFLPKNIFATSFIYFPFLLCKRCRPTSHSKIGLIWVTFVTFWKLYLCCNLFVDRCSTSEKVLSTQQTLVRARPTQKCPKQTVCRSFSTVDIYCNPDHARNVTNNINWITWVMDNCCLLFSSEFTKEQKESLSRCRIFLWKKIFLSKRSHSDLILKLSQL